MGGRPKRGVMREPERSLREAFGDLEVGRFEYSGSDKSGDCSLIISGDLKRSVGPLRGEGVEKTKASFELEVMSFTCLLTDDVPRVWPRAELEVRVSGRKLRLYPPRPPLELPCRIVPRRFT